MQNGKSSTPTLNTALGCSNAKEASPKANRAAQAIRPRRGTSGAKAPRKHAATAGIAAYEARLG